MRAACGKQPVQARLLASEDHVVPVFPNVPGVPVQAWGERLSKKEEVRCLLHPLHRRRRAPRPSVLPTQPLAPHLPLLPPRRP
jgi:hypothetical protein